ncbi:MAG: AAA family ATPase [Candidatus Lokiarchaeota archaeon]|nr:AAA family ATPase [Candidatus Lokiarchaeota archaeon]
MKKTHCPFIILISGTPGTGKTSLTHKISQELDGRMFSLGDFVVENRLYTDSDDDTDGKIVKNEIAAKVVATKFLTEFADTSIIIIESHYVDIILDGFMQIKKEFSCATDYIIGKNIIGIVLRCHPNILRTRLVQRQYSFLKIIENLQAEILSESTQNLLEVLPKERILEVDTSEYGVDELSATICANFSQFSTDKEVHWGVLRKVGMIDWIQELSEEGTLDSFFKNNVGEAYPLEFEDLNDEDKNGV